MHKGGLLLTPCTRVGPPRRVLRAAVRQIGSDKLSWMAEQSRWAPAHRCSEWGLRDAGPEAGHFAKLCLPEYLFGLIPAIHTHTCTYMIHTDTCEIQAKKIDKYNIHTRYRHIHAFCTYAFLKTDMHVLKIHANTYAYIHIHTICIALDIQHGYIHIQSNTCRYIQGHFAAYPSGKCMYLCICVHMSCICRAYVCIFMFYVVCMCICVHICMYRCA